MKKYFLLKFRKVNNRKLCITNPYLIAVLYSDILNGTRIKWFLRLSFCLGIKISVIHHPENYLHNISSSLFAQERSHIVFCFFLYFSRENLSISCWLLDWLQRDSLKILKKKKKSGIQYKSNISYYQSCAQGIMWGFYSERCH